mgnify:CR=1 FL=1
MTARNRCGHAFVSRVSWSPGSRSRRLSRPRGSRSGPSPPSPVDTFTYLAGFSTLILGLAVAKLLQGLADLVVGVCAWSGFLLSYFTGTLSL